MSKWHKGPPPSVGWWPASTSRWCLSIRWWDGKKWSYPALPDFTSARAAKAAKTISRNDECDIEWRDRPDNWPPQSRT